MDMSKVSEITISSSAGGLSAALHLPAVLPAPVVVCCHGLLSSKSGTKYLLLGERLSSAGMTVVRFDFAGCGESTTRPGETLLDTRMRDLYSVLDFVAGQPWFDGNLGIMGSSFGGFLALLAAGSEKFPVKSVVCWATPFDLTRARVDLRDIEELKKFYPPGFELGEPQNLGNLSPVPGVLILHGQRDEVIPWRDAEDIFRLAGEPRRLVLMEKGDHRFLDQDLRDSAIDLTIEWLCTHVRA